MIAYRLFFYGCLLFLFGLFLFHGTSFVKAQDLSVLQSVQACHSGFLNNIAIFSAILGSPIPSVLSLGLLAALFLWQKKWRELLLFVSLFVLMTGFEYVSKINIVHPRPAKEFVLNITGCLFGYLPGVNVPGDNSFPSGHCVRSIFLAGVLAILLGPQNRKTQILAVLAVAAYCLVSGWSRVYLGAHWPSDVLGGFALGGAGVMIFLLGQDFLEGKI